MLWGKVDFYLTFFPWCVQKSIKKPKSILRDFLMSYTVFSCCTSSGVLECENLRQKLHRQYTNRKVMYGTNIPVSCHDFYSLCQYFKTCFKILLCRTLSIVVQIIQQRLHTVGKTF